VTEAAARFVVLRSGRESRDRLEILTALIDGPGFDPLFRDDVIRVPRDHPALHWNCLIEGCDGYIRARELCGNHLIRWREAEAAGVERLEFLRTAVPNLGSLARDVEDYLIGLLCDTITNLPDPQVSATLLELWRVREEEFDPDAPGSDLNLNADDVPTTNFDHPQHQLLDLIIDTITARLLKRHGPELLLAWADAVEEAHRQHT